MFKENGWISVKDRLPEHKYEASEDVIYAIIKSGKIKIWGRANVGINGSWYKDGLCLNNIPTHWMVLLNAS